MAEPIDEYFTATVAAMHSSTRRRADDDPVRDGSSLTTRVSLALFDVQLGSRHLDLAARWLRAQGRGYYTIGSSGHEGNAAVAAALRPTDPALLHYRSGAFFLARAALVDGREPLRDVLLGMVAATEEPISGGRHKVFGRHDLHIIPQTSTIASHLPRAVGVAFSIARARKLGVDVRMARRRGHGVQLRRCVGEPLDRGRCDQHRDALRISGRADAAAVRLRRQRDRYQRQDATRLDRADLRKPRRPGVFRRRRVRSARDVRCRHRGRRLGTHPSAARVPAPANGPVDGARRIRLRSRVPATRRDSRRLRTRSVGAHRETAGDRGCVDAIRGDRPLRGQARRGDGAGRTR